MDSAKLSVFYSFKTFLSGPFSRRFHLGPTWSIVHPRLTWICLTFSIQTVIPFHMKLHVSISTKTLHKSKLTRMMGSDW